MIQLTLYYREACHLCEVMLAELAPYLAKPEVSLQRVDIDEHAEWLEAYNELVPVLHVDEEPLCKYYLDTVKLDAFLSSD